jgi:hypothetical protein
VNVQSGAFRNGFVTRQRTLSADATASSSAVATGPGAIATANAEAVATVHVDTGQPSAAQASNGGTSGKENTGAEDDAGGDAQTVFVPTSSQAAEAGTDTSASGSLW